MDWILHVKVAEGDNDAVASGSSDDPRTVTVVRVRAREVRTLYDTVMSSQFITTVCEKKWCLCE